MLELKSKARGLTLKLSVNLFTVDLELQEASNMEGGGIFVAKQLKQGQKAV